MTDRATPCPSCRKSKAPGRYVCWDCWGGLTVPARRALNRRDARAFARLRELHRQLEASVPLAEIQITV